MIAGVVMLNAMTNQAGRCTCCGCEASEMTGGRPVTDGRMCWLCLDLGHDGLADSMAALNA